MPDNEHRLPGKLDRIIPVILRQVLLPGAYHQNEFVARSKNYAGKTVALLFVCSSPGGR